MPEPSSRNAQRKGPTWASLAVGQILRAGGTLCRIAEIEDGWVTLEHCDTGASRLIKEEDLRGHISVAIVRNVETAANGLAVEGATPEEQDIISRLPSDVHSPAAVAMMLHKLRWIGALRSRGTKSFADLDNLELELLNVAKFIRPGTRTFRPSTIRSSWAKLDAAGGDSRVLLPNFHLRGGVGNTRVDPVAEALLQKRLESEKATDTRLRISDLVEGHALDVNVWNSAPANAKVQTEPLSEMTIARRFHSAFERYEILRRNVGKPAADRWYRNTGVRIRAEEPLEAAQFDDTDGEVFLIDEISGLPWGRANITAGIDEATAAVLGKEISEQPRSTWSAISAMVNAVLPKDMSADEFAMCTHSWFAYGAVGVAQMDNALYNHGAGYVEGAVADTGAIPGWSKPRTPTGKTQIEYLNNLIKTDFTPELPGWRGPKRDRDGLKDGPSSAVMSLHEYRRAFNHWVTDRYSNKPREKGESPRQLWERHFSNSRPMMPIDTQAFRLIATMRQTLKFRQSGGLMRMGLRYASKSLELLRNRLGFNAEVDIRFHPFDLSTMYAFDPIARTFLVVPCIEHADYLKGLTNHQQKLILKRCREKGLKNPSILDCTVAKEELRRLAAQLRLSKKLTDRKNARRANDAEFGADVQPKKKVMAEPVIVVTELERQLNEMDAIDLTGNDADWRDEPVAA